MARLCRNRVGQEIPVRVISTENEPKRGIKVCLRIAAAGQRYVVVQLHVDDHRCRR
jgi:hypothetical protein